MKCHIATRPGVTYTGILNVLVEDPGTSLFFLDHGHVDTKAIKGAARTFLTKHGARHGVEWFEMPGEVRFRMVKHQMGDTYALVAVVPFKARVVAS